MKKVDFLVFFNESSRRKILKTIADIFKRKLNSWYVDIKLKSYSQIFYVICNFIYDWENLSDDDIKVT